MVRRSSAMRWMPRPKSWGFFAVKVRVLTPIHAISDDRRPYSIFGQRFITTFRPFGFGELRGFVTTDPKLHPDHLRPRLERERSQRSQARTARPERCRPCRRAQGISASLA